VSRENVFSLFCSMSLLFSLTASSMAKDYESAHKVSAGDVISADIINEFSMRSRISEDINRE